MMLLAILIDTEALKIYVPPRSELRLHWTGDVDGALQPKLLHPTLHNRELNRNLTSHLDSATERNLAIALREVQIPSREFGAFDVDGEVDFGAAGEVLDVTVAAVLGSAGDGSCAFFANLFFHVVAAGADVGGLWFGWKSDNAVHVAAFANELGFAVVPCFQDFVRWGAT